jgi:hypothetical protein
MEAEMAKALEVNDKPAQNKSAETHNEQKLQGKALQVNENTEEGQTPAKSPENPPRG